MRILLALVALFFAGNVHAECTGSGTNWNCTAGTSIAQVNSAISSSSDGATITMAAGPYSWGSSLSFNNARATSLVCATVGGCTVTMSGPLWQSANWGSTDKLRRISGFVFNNVRPYFIWLYGTGSSAATMTSVRFDNNTVNVSSSGSDIITFGEVSGRNTTVFGVIDHNVFRTNSGNTRWIVNYSQDGPGTWPTGRIGTINNLFIEDNQFTDQCTSNAGNAALDTDGGSLSWVVRNNSFTNARIEHHGYYWSFPGPANSEVYGNSFNWTCGAETLNGSYSMKHQGSGEWIVFNNTVTPGNGKGSAHILQNYRSFYDNESNRCNGTAAEDGNRAPLETNRGYPCNRQPGRDASGQLKPQYYWNNKWSDGAAITLSRSCPGSTSYCANHIQANRDYYQGSTTAQTSQTSPFNGTSGVGFGVLANRPTTCTTGAETGGGVAYWATDTSTLYRCSAPNSWSVHYRPFTYPHPLTLGGVREAAPNPPTDVTVTQ